MTLDLLKQSGVPLDKQVFTWRDLVPSPLSCDNDALSRIRVLTLAAVEAEAVRFSHSTATANRNLQLPLAQVRRVDQHQRTMVSWLQPADLSPLEMSLAHEQCSVEMTALVTRQELDPGLASVFRFVMLEDLDHVFRFSALLHRLEDKDPNRVLQDYTDALPARPTRFSHRAPEDELRESYDCRMARALSKINVRTLLALKHQVYQFYMNVGPLHANPMARQLYAEIASIEEQHLTQYGSLLDHRETPLESWLLWEACEAYAYYCAALHETDERLRAVWERFVDYELGQLQVVRRLFERFENRDVQEVLPEALPDPMPFKGQRQFITDTRERECRLRAAGHRFIDCNYELSEAAGTVRYRDQLHRDGCAADQVVDGYSGIEAAGH